VGLDPDSDLLALDALDDDFEGTVHEKHSHRGYQRQVCRWLDFDDLPSMDGPMPRAQGCAGAAGRVFG